MFLSIFKLDQKATPPVGEAAFLPDAILPDWMGVEKVESGEMSPVKQFPYTPILGWSMSRFNLFSICKRKYYYHYYNKFPCRWRSA
jgi:hypothetical protein